jgi:hypothetical protein
VLTNSWIRGMSHLGRVLVNNFANKLTRLIGLKSFGFAASGVFGSSYHGCGVQELKVPCWSRFHCSNIMHHISAYDQPAILKKRADKPSVPGVLSGGMSMIAAHTSSRVIGSSWSDRSTWEKPCLWNYMEWSLWRREMPSRFWRYDQMVSHCLLAWSSLNFRPPQHDGCSFRRLAEAFQWNRNLFVK